MFVQLGGEFFIFYFFGQPLVNSIWELKKKKNRREIFAIWISMFKKEKVYCIAVYEWMCVCVGEYGWALLINTL